MSLPATTPGQRPGDDNKLARSFYRESSGVVSRDLGLKELSACIREGKGPLWVDIDTSVRPQMALLEKVFGFHPLAIEDVLNPNGRAKVEAYDGYIFVVLRAVRLQDQTPDPYDLDTENVHFFISQNVLVTTHHGPSRLVDSVADVVVRNTDLLARGPGRLAHQVMDAAVDSFFPVMDRIDDFIDSLETQVFHQFNEEALRDIFAVKRLVLSLRRYLAPEREIFNVLTNRPSPFLAPDIQLYYRDIYDHVLRINDALDTYRDLLSSTLESYLSQVSNRLGKVTQGLTVVATMSVPFVVVSGMWGMNFDRIPLAGRQWGFEIMLVLQLALGVGLLVWLRRMKLFS
ncbi:MAG TPA: magnesium transporter CorA family protein [Gemmatimonadaceae bacterium]